MTQSNTDALRSFFGETGVATLRQMERICLNSQTPEADLPFVRLLSRSSIALTASAISCLARSTDCCNLPWQSTQAFSCSAI